MYSEDWGFTDFARVSMAWHWCRRFSDTAMDHEERHRGASAACSAELVPESRRRWLMDHSQPVQRVRIPLQQTSCIEPLCK